MSNAIIYPYTMMTRSEINFSCGGIYIYSDLEMQDLQTLQCFDRAGLMNLQVVHVVCLKRI
jgi:hypothetical protein